MSMTGLDAFDTTVHKTNRWLNELNELAGWDSKQKAYLATRATLHALRDRITVDEVAQLGAQLPMLMRGSSSSPGSHGSSAATTSSRPSAWPAPSSRC